MAVKTPAPERAAARQSLAKRRLALPDGSFPVPNAGYWDKARKAIGRVKNPSKRAKVAALLRKTAKRFGKTKALNQSWAAPGGSKQTATPTRGGLELASGPMPYSRDDDETVRCPNCGKYNAPDARYCDQCGAKLPASAFANLSGGGGALELSRQPGDGMRRALGIGDRGGSGQALRRRPVPVTSPYDLHVTRASDGRAVVTHRRSGDKIGEVSRTDDGRYTGRLGAALKELQPHTHQRAALMELVARHNATVTTGERLVQRPQQTPLMARLGIPAVSAIGLATQVTSASDGPRVTSAGGSNGDAPTGLTPKGVSIYRKLRKRNFPADRALAFAKRAQNFGNRGG